MRGLGSPIHQRDGFAGPPTRIAMPMEQASKYLLVINLKTAKASGLAFPATALARTDKVIE